MWAGYWAQGYAIADPFIPTSGKVLLRSLRPDMQSPFTQPGPGGVKNHLSDAVNGRVRYALIVSLNAAAVVDLYTPIQIAASIPIVIEPDDNPLPP